MRNYLREGVDALANSEGRQLTHVGKGLLIVAGALAVSALMGGIAAREAEVEEADRDQGEEPRQLSAVWTPLFLALTVSGFRIWNAPRSPRRDLALGLWATVQGLNLFLMVFGPKRLGGQTAVALAATGSALAYSKAAQRVDRGAAALVTPFVGWGSIATLVADNLRGMPKRKTHPVQVTVH